MRTKDSYNGIGNELLQRLAVAGATRPGSNGSEEPMKTMLLAAGRGERMGSLCETLPKPLLNLVGETLIERQIRLLRAAGQRELVINLSWHGAQIRRRLGDGAQHGVAIEYAEEGEPPLETAGGIVNALPLLGPQPFLVANSDIVTDFDFSMLPPLAGKLSGGRDGLLGALVLVANPPHHREGDYAVDARGLARMSGKLLTYSGISALHPDLFVGVTPGRGKLRPLFDAAISAGRIAGLVHEGLWIDVGTPERLQQAQQALR